MLGGRLDGGMDGVEMFDVVCRFSGSRFLRFTGVGGSGLRFGSRPSWISIKNDVDGSEFARCAPLSLAHILQSSVSSSDGSDRRSS